MNFLKVAQLLAPWLGDGMNGVRPLTVLKE